MNNTATTTYTFTPNAGQCASTTTMTITVNPNITPTFTAIGPLCVNSVPPALPASSTNIPAITGTWNPATISTSTAGTFIYTFTPTLGVCASSTTISITIVNQIVPTFAQIGPLCQNSVPPALPATSTNVPPVAGSWNPTTISTGTVGTTVYTFTPTGGNCETTATMSITVNPIPVVTATATPAVICNGDQSTLTATSTVVGTNFDWMPGSLTGTPVTVTPTVTTTYTLTGSTAANCSGIATVTVTVNPTPVLTPTATPAAICEGASSTLTVNSNIPATFGWMPGGLPGTPVTVTPAVTTIYTVAGMTAAGCSATDTITVTVNPNPVVTPTATPAVICDGDQTSLSASSTVAGNNLLIGLRADMVHQ